MTKPSSVHRHNAADSVRCGHPELPSCNASELVRHLAGENPSQGSVRLTAQAVGAGVPYQRVQREEAAAVPPSEKYEWWISVLTGQSTQREAAEKYRIDRPVHGAAHLQGRQAEIPCRNRSSCGAEVGRAWPGSCFVVDGAGLEAAVQDADEPVGQLAKGSAVSRPASAESVVVGAGSR